MPGSFSHPANDGTADSPSRSWDNWVYIFIGLGGIGFLPEFGAPERLRVFGLFFLVVFVIVLLVGITKTVGLVRLRFAHETADEDGQNDGPSETGTADPRTWIQSAFEPGLLVYAQMLLMQLHPIVLARGVAQLGGGVVATIRHRGRLPNPDRFDSTTPFHPPFSGTWTVLNGSPDPEYSHSWSPIRQRYAYDFVITDDDGQTHDGTDLESFYCFDEPIRAPAAGTVVRARDGHRDYHRTNGWLDPLQYRLAGNYVLIKHAENEYSFLAHLKNGSICVAEDEEVTQGQEIGRCGHSGNSTEPHLHFHVQDHAVPYIGAGLPIQFVGETTDTGTEDERPIWVHCGQVLTAPEISVGPR